MFTGIVERTGEVVKMEAGGDGGRIWIRDAILADVADGASVAVDGVCLTVAGRDADTCRFDLSGETLARSTLGGREVGDRVNLERPVRMGDELGGHIVQGHVDGVGRIEAIFEEDGASRMTVGIPPALLRYLVEKGSVTVDGVSLTVTALEAGGFDVALVPHTLAVTTLGEAVPGRPVNIEVDVVAKYVERLVRPWTPPDGEGADPKSSGYL